MDAELHWCAEDPEKARDPGYGIKHEKQRPIRIDVTKSHRVEKGDQCAASDFADAFVGARGKDAILEDNLVLLEGLGLEIEREIKGDGFAFEGARVAPDVEIK